jgi:hypothetical protein
VSAPNDDTTELPIVRVRSDQARALADVIAIKQDLDFVAQAADRLVELLSTEEADGVLTRALQTAALIAYVRCFASGKRYGLNEETLDRGPEGAREYHEHLKDLRDKHIAHSVNPFEQTLIAVILSSDERTVEGVAQLSAQHLSFDQDGAEQLASYARRLSTVLDSEGRRLTEAVQAESEASLEDLRSRPRGLEIRVPGPDQVGKPRQQ